MSCEIYGIYRKMMYAAWRCLADHEVDSLPVSTAAIARAVGIRVIKNSAAGILRETALGESVYQESTDRWAIVYDDRQSPDESRYTVAHELGHIFLGHERRGGVAAFDGLPAELEDEAERFAARLLAPACVLWALDVHEADEIARICGLPKRYAIQRAARMAELYAQNRFLTSPLEEKVYNNFENWIKNNKTC